MIARRKPELKKPSRQGLGIGEPLGEGKPVGAFGKGERRRRRPLGGMVAQRVTRRGEGRQRRHCRTSRAMMLRWISLAPS